MIEAFLSYGYYGSNVESIFHTPGLCGEVLLFVSVPRHSVYVCLST